MSARRVLLIVLRELGQYASTWSGYLIAAALLLLTGLFYNVFGVGSVPQFSRDVLANAFYFSSGTTLAAGILFAMRQFAEERQTGTLPLLLASPASDAELVVAKYMSAFVPVLIYIALSSYVPMLVFVRGQVSLGHVFAGLLGVASIGSAGVAIGLFGSALFRSQLVAAIVSGVIAVVMLVLWKTSQLVDGVLGELIAAFSLHDDHFRPFMEGTISLANLIYYASVTAFFLVLSRNVLEAKRWRA
ncbi:MAG: ABC transporter permease subunit [Myxococcales bacterium]|nr:ABC transporter permease subunit [Myxococcales bacterium]